MTHTMMSGIITPGTKSPDSPASPFCWRYSAMKKPSASSPHACVKEKPVYDTAQPTITA